MLSTFRNPDYWFNVGFNSLLDGLDLPLAETQETPDEIVYRWSAAGLSEKDIEITQETRGLSTQITVKTPTKIVRKLLKYGFDPATGDAVLENGVLALTFKRYEGTKPKAIAVRRPQS